MRYFWEETNHFLVLKHHAMQEGEGRFDDKVPRILYFAIGERSVSRSGRFIPWTHGYPLSREAVWAVDMVAEMTVPVAAGN